MTQHDIETLQSNLDSLGIFDGQTVDIVSDDIHVFEEVENETGLSSVNKVRKNIANLSLQVISIDLKQF